MDDSSQVSADTWAVTEISWINGTTDVIQETSGRKGRVTIGCHVFDLTMRLGVHGGLVLLGLVGNILTIKILHHLIYRSATFFCLYALAIADGLVITFIGSVSIPTAIMRTAGRYQEAHRYYLSGASALSAGISGCLVLSTWMTVVVTWHRYVSVCMPYKVKTYGSVKVAKIQVLVVYVLSFVFTFPRWFESKVVTDDIGTITIVYSNFVKTHGYKILYAIILNNAVVYIFPFLFLAYMTVALILSLKKARSKHQNIMSSSKKKDDDLNLSLIIVVVIFLVCRIFGPLRRLLVTLYPSAAARQCGGILYFFEPNSQTASILNSAINFIIYILFARRFRRMLVSSMGLPCGKSSVSPETNTSTFGTASSGHNNDSTHPTTTHVSTISSSL